MAKKNLIVKKKGEDIIYDDVNQYELFKVEKVKDINGVDVEVPRSLGTFGLRQLLTQRDQLTKQLAEIEEKIDAINKIKGIN